MSDIDPGETAAPPAPSPPRYFRDTRHRIVGGVASGLGASTGVDVAVIRVAFVISALLHGAGVLAYLAGWVAMPGEEEARAGRSQAERPLRLLASAVLAALAVAVLVQPFAGSPDTFPVLLPVLLIGVGIALWRPGPARRFGAPASPPVPDGPPDDPATPGSPAGPPAPAASWGWRRQPASPLGRLTIGALLLVLGVALALDRAGVIRMTASAAVGLALLVLGGGMVVGTMLGRARWLAFLVVPLAPLALLFGTFDRMGLDVFASSDPVTVQTIGDLRPDYRRGVGAVDLELQEVDFGGRSKSVSIESAAGVVRVAVPAGVAVSVDGEAAVGELLEGRPDGPPVRFGRRGAFDLPGQPGAGQLHLRIRVGVGDIIVERASPLPQPAPSPSPTPTPTQAGGQP